MGGRILLLLRHDRGSHLGSHRLPLVEGHSRHGIRRRRRHRRHGHRTGSLDIHHRHHVLLGDLRVRLASCQAGWFAWGRPASC
jgi:hypothetical protein